MRLGIPQIAGSTALVRRLAWISGARLLFLTVSLGLIGAFYLPHDRQIDGPTLRLALATFAVSFALAAAYAFLLRTGRHLNHLANAQVVLDQLTWTVVVYLTGGPSSGATSFYGLSCLVGASLTGLRGAALAAASGGVFYGALVTLLQKGWLEPPSDQPLALYRLSADELSFYVLVNLLVLVVVMLLAGNLAERLRWTGGELVAATARAEKAERMAALGRLAAGLAHEIRNPLGSIAGSVQLLRMTPVLSEEDQKLCDIIEREASRLNDLVTDMLDLSKPRAPAFAPADAAAIAREVVELGSRSGRAVSDVELVYEGPERALVWADAAQLRQLIWNLVRNAVQASNAGDAVRVEIAVEPDERVELRVCDQGAGIDELAKQRLFDAFFTTRAHGTGVGLAVVKRIADEHGFTIQVESNAGRGATFRVGLGRLHSVQLESDLTQN